MKVEDKRTDLAKLYSLNELTGGTPVMNVEIEKLAIVTTGFGTITAIYPHSGEMSGEAKDRKIWRLVNAKVVIED